MTKRPYSLPAPPGAAPVWFPSTCADKNPVDTPTRLKAGDSQFSDNCPVSRVLHCLPERLAVGTTAFPCAPRYASGQPVSQLSEQQPWRGAWFSQPQRFLFLQRFTRPRTWSHPSRGFWPEPATSSFQRAVPRGMTRLSHKGCPFSRVLIGFDVLAKVSRLISPRLKPGALRLGLVKESRECSGGARRVPCLDSPPRRGPGAEAPPWPCPQRRGRTLALGVSCGDHNA